jgi:hypothetical protein
VAAMVKRDQPVLALRLVKLKRSELIFLLPCRIDASKEIMGALHAAPRHCAVHLGP